ncbi:MAG: hypothetical protein WDN28_30380 [Chthoniobacter sp.]
MASSDTDSFVKGIADVVAAQSTNASIASFDLAKLIAPTAMRTVLESMPTYAIKQAASLGLANSSLFRAARELSALPRMGEAFAASLSLRSDALMGIGQTMKELMWAFQTPLPRIGEAVAEMMAQSAAISKAMEGFRFQTSDLHRSLFAEGHSIQRMMEGIRLPAMALDFPQLTAGFQVFLQESERAGEELSATLAAIPSRELFLSGDACLVFEDVEPLEPAAEQEREAARAEIDAYVWPTFEMMLADLEPQLVVLWNGAREAASSHRSDCARHVLTSLRELYREMMNRLAPDTAVSAWSTEPADFVNGQPTRLARHRYALRNLRSPALKRFLELDMKFVSELLGIFNRGTHCLESALSENELPFMIRRVEGFLCALFEAQEID